MPRRGHVPLEYAQSAVPVNMSTVYAERRRLSTVSRPAAGRDAAGAAYPCSAVAGHPAVLKNQVVDVANAGPEVFHGGVLLALRAIGQSMQGRGKSFLSIFFWPGRPMGKSPANSSGPLPRRYDFHASQNCRSFLKGKGKIRRETGSVFIKMETDPVFPGGPRRAVPAGGAGSGFLW